MTAVQFTVQPDGKIVHDAYLLTKKEITIYFCHKSQLLIWNYRVIYFEILDHALALPVRNQFNLLFYIF